MDTTINGTAVKEVADLARQVVVPQTGEDIHYVVIPQGMQVFSLKDVQYPHGLPPTRIIAAPTFADQASFCSYVNSYKDERTRIAADPVKLTFTGFIDYHRGGDPEMVKPEFVSHKPSFKLEHSEQWKLWIKKNDVPITQGEFAEFIDDNRADISKPAAADLVEIVEQLTAKSEVNFQSKINRANGAATLNYTENIDAKFGSGSIEVPETFTLIIPVFFGESPISIPCRLRFRINDGKLKFEYKMYRPMQTVMEAFEGTRQDIRTATTVEVLLGSL